MHNHYWRKNTQHESCEFVSLSFILTEKCITQEIAIQ